MRFKLIKTKRFFKLVFLVRQNYVQITQCSIVPNRVYETPYLK